MKRLLIVRHGNTFTADQTPTRVGCHTDLPLVETQLGRNIGQYLTAQHIVPDEIYAAPLQRTLSTAELIAAELPQPPAITPLSDFLEIDYGPDENCTEQQVVARLGAAALAQQGVKEPDSAQIVAAGEAVIARWNQHAEVPTGWCVDVDKIIATWQNFAATLADNKTVLVVSSNGIIRFAPTILSAAAYSTFLSEHTLKVKTGSLSIFDYQDGEWQCRLWNQRP